MRCLLRESQDEAKEGLVVVGRWHRRSMPSGVMFVVLVAIRGFISGDHHVLPHVVVCCRFSAA